MTTHVFLSLCRLLSLDRARILDMLVAVLTPGVTPKIIAHQAFFALHVYIELPQQS